jgi:hypothetical protein
MLLPEETWVISFTSPRTYRTMTCWVRLTSARVGLPRLTRTLGDLGVSSADQVARPMVLVGLMPLTFWNAHTAASVVPP